MSWYAWGPTKPMAQLKAESLKLIANPPEEFGELRPVAAEGRKQTVSRLGTAFAEAAVAYGGNAARATKARGCLRHHCLIDLRVKDGNAAARTAREGGGADGRVHGSDTYETAFRLKPPPTGWWEGFAAEHRKAMSPADAALLAAGRLPEAVSRALATTDSPLLPQPRGVATSCDCLNGASACKHVLCTMLGLAVLIDRQGEVLLRVHGLDLADLAPDLAASLPAPGDLPADALDDAAVARLFGDG